MSPHHHALLHVQAAENVTRVTITTNVLDEDNLQAIGEGLIAIADGLTQPGLELDMAQVQYLTSTCLGKLVALNTRLRDRGCHLVLVNVNARVYEVFEVTKLHRVLDIRAGSDAGPGRPLSAPLAPDPPRSLAE